MADAGNAFMSPTDDVARHSEFCNCRQISNTVSITTALRYIHNINYYQPDRVQHALSECSGKYHGGKGSLKSSAWEVLKHHSGGLSLDELIQGIDKLGEYESTDSSQVHFFYDGKMAMKRLLPLSSFLVICSCTQDNNVAINVLLCSPSNRSYCIDAQCRVAPYCCLYDKVCN